jgi:hypothetical protein
MSELNCLILYGIMTCIIIMLSIAFLAVKDQVYELQTKLIILADTRPELEALLDYLFIDKPLAQTVHNYDKEAAKYAAQIAKQNMLKRESVLPKAD